MRGYGYSCLACHAAWCGGDSLTTLIEHLRVVHGRAPHGGYPGDEISDSFNEDACEWHGPPHDHFEARQSRRGDK